MSAACGTTLGNRRSKRDAATWSAASIPKVALTLDSDALAVLATSPSLSESLSAVLSYSGEPATTEVGETASCSAPSLSCPSLGVYSAMPDSTSEATSDEGETSGVQHLIGEVG